MFFPEISSPLLPKASRRGVAKSGEVTGGDGGSPTNQRGKSQGGLVWKLGKSFFGKKNRSRFFGGYSARMVGVVINPDS